MTTYDHSGDETDLFKDLTSLSSDDALAFLSNETSGHHIVFKGDRENELSKWLKKPALMWC